MWKLETKADLSMFSTKENKFVTVIYDNFINTEKIANIISSPGKKMEQAHIQLYINGLSNKILKAKP